MLIGYVDEWSVAPGDLVELKVSTDAAEYDLELIRLRHADRSPAGPGRRVTVVDHPANGTYPGRMQPTTPGSYMVAPAPDSWGERRELTFEVWMCATRPDAAGAIVHLEGRPWDLAVGTEGTDVVATLSDGGGSVAAKVEGGAATGRWVLVVVRVGDGLLSLDVVGDRDRGTSTETTGDVGPVRLSSIHLGRLGDGPGTFNGRLERPRLYGRRLTDTELASTRTGEPASGRLADWDFSLIPETTTAVDTSGYGAHGRLVNLPTRLVAGRSHDPAVTDPRQHPAMFGAIHFHDDDLADAGWETSVRIRLPDDLAGGVYAAHLRSGGEEDDVPFFVRTDRPTGERILFLVPTLTYMAYANERALETIDLEDSGVVGRELEPSPLDELSRSHREWGLSQYDLHSDGSPVVFSSRRRPIPNLRPDYRHWTLGAPRGLSGDLYIVDWLEEQGHPWALCTDEDLHRDGTARLRPYDVVVTGTHPEYWTAPMLDALEAFLAEGGSLMYLGGNGFYAVTTLHPELAHVSEVRRNVAGTRPSEPMPWEAHHLDGELGGIWRHRGRAPNRLAGVGFTAQGWDDDPRPYVRSEASYSPEAAWLFEGIEEETIGGFGLVMGSAMGDEIDRYDPSLGSPPDALVLATGNPSGWYLLASEDILITSPSIDGETNPLVRSDVVLFETGAGGAVFSVGSISWAGALSHNGYDNSVSRLTGNALRGILEGPDFRARGR
ncbi:MAG: N,N-dimethylformamidase beta subunit family domain-containing protein [Actinomycetota bacterium]